MYEANQTYPTIVVMISANIEWRAIRAIFPRVEYRPSPYGEWFRVTLSQSDVWAGSELASKHGRQPLIFLHGGWGKIAAAGSAQFAIDHWHPDLLINLGTCGGFEGQIERGTVILVDRTIVYDIIEQMADPEEELKHYTVENDLSWLQRPYPHPVQRGLLVSGDRDLVPEDIPSLISRFGASAGDWESGGIAYVASRNRQRFMILRGVTDLVGSSGGEAYGNIGLFEQAAADVLGYLVAQLPDWLAVGGLLD